MVRTRTATLSLVALSALVFACTTTTPFGEVEVKPTKEKAPLQKYVGTFQAEDGKIYQLFDNNGDGKIDKAYDPGSKKWYDVIEIPPGAPSGGGLNSKSPTLRGYPLLPANVQILKNDPAVPMPVQFTQTAAQYIAQYGLDQLHVGVVSIHDDAIHLNAFDAASTWVDVTLAWNGLYTSPSPLAYGLQYEFRGIADTWNAAPEFVFERVVGPGQQVAKWLVAHDVIEVSWPTTDGLLEFSLSDHASVLVILDGTLLYDVPLQ